jgi:HAE1 family hydrophobic/amphiphilic exporter-1
VEQDIRDALEDLDAEFEVSGQSMDMTAMMGSGISVEVRGLEFDTLEDLAQQAAEIVEGVEGTTEIDNGISKGAPALKITVDKDKAIENSLTVAQVFSVVDSAVNPNNKAGELTLGSRDYDILVKNGSDGDLTISEIKNLEITTLLGETVKLRDIADVSEEAGYASITRNNQERTITVEAALEEGYNIGIVGDEVKEALEDIEVPEGYTVELVGESEEINSALRDLALALAMAVALIYMVMAAQFESFKYPFIVMFAIPLAFTGGFLALIITNTPLSVVALIGMIILAGIVVNNGIVLVDYINQLKERGMTSHKAIMKAGRTRLRPIVMTALTTIFALSTMSIGVGRGAEMMQPLAITAIGGLIFSTALTLIVIPAMYAAFDKEYKNKEKSNENG